MARARRASIASAVVGGAMMMMISTTTATALEIDLVHRGDGAYDDMKCVSEDIHANAVVLFAFETVMEGDEVSVKVFDAKGKVAWEKNDATSGRHGFTSETEGEHRACFYKPELTSLGDEKAKAAALAKHRVRVDWKHGVAATEWKSLAKATDLDAFTRTLRALEADLREVHDGMLNLRALEAEMRDMNESTNAKVAWLSVLSLSVCVGMCVWQIVYLKGFFERKKLL
jgi:phosphatidylinositol glycan class A protein|tara:strand:+ start:97 stop:780 length:684 start_codon:yes stop_codon:yes gene_type:complete